MAKELGTAGEIVTANVGGGFNNLKATVYNFLGNFFSWLSTHQGLALLIIIIVLGIIIWLFLRGRKIGKQLEEKVSRKNIDIGKKDALIEEQKDKLEVLQKKMSDQQKVVSESLLKTLMILTGYNLDQLKIFFRSLTGIDANPLQKAAAQANSLPKSQQLEKVRDDSTEENVAKAKIAPGSGPEKGLEAGKSEEE